MTLGIWLVLLCGLTASIGLGLLIAFYLEDQEEIEDDWRRDLRRMMR